MRRIAVVKTLEDTAKNGPLTSGDTTLNVLVYAGQRRTASHIGGAMLTPDLLEAMYPVPEKKSGEQSEQRESKATSAASSSPPAMLAPIVSAPAVVAPTAALVRTTPTSPEEQYQIHVIRIEEILWHKINNLEFQPFKRSLYLGMIFAKTLLYDNKFRKDDDFTGLHLPIFSTTMGYYYEIGRGKALYWLVKNSPAIEASTIYEYYCEISTLYQSALQELRGTKKQMEVSFPYKQYADVLDTLYELTKKKANDALTAKSPLGPTYLKQMKAITAQKATIAYWKAAASHELIICDNEKINFAEEMDKFKNKFKIQVEMYQDELRYHVKTFTDFLKIKQYQKANDYLASLWRKDFLFHNIALLNALPGYCEISVREKIRAAFEKSFSPDIENLNGCLPYGDEEATRLVVCVYLIKKIRSIQPTIVTILPSNLSEIMMDNFLMPDKNWASRKAIYLGKKIGAIFTAPYVSDRNVAELDNTMADYDLTVFDCLNDMSAFSASDEPVGKVHARLLNSDRYIQDSITKEFLSTMPGAKANSTTLVTLYLSAQRYIEGYQTILSGQIKDLIEIISQNQLDDKIYEELRRLSRHNRIWWEFHAMMISELPQNKIKLLQPEEKEITKISSDVLSFGLSSEKAKQLLDLVLTRYPNIGDKHVHLQNFLEKNNLSMSQLFITIFKKTSDDLYILRDDSLAMVAHLAPLILKKYRAILHHSMCFKFLDNEASEQVKQFCILNPEESFKRFEDTTSNIKSRYAVHGVGMFHAYYSLFQANTDDKIKLDICNKVNAICSQMLTAHQEGLALSITFEACIEMLAFAGWLIIKERGHHKLTIADKKLITAKINNILTLAILTIGLDMSGTAIRSYDFEKSQSLILAVNQLERFLVAIKLRKKELNKLINAGQLKNIENIFQDLKLAAKGMAKPTEPPSLLKLKESAKKSREDDIKSICEKIEKILLDMKEGRLIAASDAITKLETYSLSFSMELAMDFVSLLMQVGLGDATTLLKLENCFKESTPTVEEIKEKEIKRQQETKEETKEEKKQEKISSAVILRNQPIKGIGYLEQKEKKEKKERQILQKLSHKLLAATAARQLAEKDLHRISKAAAVAENEAHQSEVKAHRAAEEASLAETEARQAKENTAHTVSLAHQQKEKVHLAKTLHRAAKEKMRLAKKKIRPLREAEQEANREFKKAEKEAILAKKIQNTAEESVRQTETELNAAEEKIDFHKKRVPQFENETLYPATKVTLCEHKVKKSEERVRIAKINTRQATKAKDAAENKLQKVLNELYDEPQKKLYEQKELAQLRKIEQAERTVRHIEEQISTLDNAVIVSEKKASAMKLRNELMIINLLAPYASRDTIRTLHIFLVNNNAEVVGSMATLAKLKMIGHEYLNTPRDLDSRSHANTPTKMNVFVRCFKKLKISTEMKEEKKGDIHLKLKPNLLLKFQQIEGRFVSSDAVSRKLLKYDHTAMLEGYESYNPSPFSRVGIEFSAQGIAKESARSKADKAVQYCYATRTFLVEFDPSKNMHHALFLTLKDFSRAHALNFNIGISVEKTLLNKKWLFDYLNTTHNCFVEINKFLLLNEPINEKILRPTIEALAELLYFREPSLKEYYIYPLDFANALIKTILSAASIACSATHSTTPKAPAKIVSDLGFFANSAEYKHDLFHRLHNHVITTLEKGKASLLSPVSPAESKHLREKLQEKLIRAQTARTPGLFSAPSKLIAGSEVHRRGVTSSPPPLLPHPWFTATAEAPAAPPSVAPTMPHRLSYFAPPFSPTTDVSVVPDNKQIKFI